MPVRNSSRPPSPTMPEPSSVRHGRGWSAAACRVFDGRLEKDCPDGEQDWMVSIDGLSLARSSPGGTSQDLRRGRDDQRSGRRGGRRRANERGGEVHRLAMRDQTLRHGTSFGGGHVRAVPLAGQRGAARTAPACRSVTTGNALGRPARRRLTVRGPQGREDRRARQLVAPAEERQLDEERRGVQLPPRRRHQVDRGAGRSAGRQHVVHDQHALALADGVVVDLERVLAVLEVVGLA